MSNTKAPIIENAINFIKNATDRLTTADPDIWEIKYAILHLFSGLVLLLKQPLVDEHWTLIFEKTDQASTSKFETGNFVSINLDSIKSRLEGIHPQIAKTIQFQKLDDLRKLRNKIEHFAIVDKKEQVVPLVYDSCNVAIDVIDKFDFQKRLPAIQDDYQSIVRNISKLSEFTTNRMKSIEPEINKIQSAGKIVVRCITCRQNALPLFDEKKKCIFCNLSHESVDFPIKWVDEFICPDPFEETLIPILSECFDCSNESLLYLDSLELYVCLNCGSYWSPEKISICEYCGLVSDGSNLKDDGCDQCWKFRYL